MIREGFFCFFGGDRGFHARASAIAGILVLGVVVPARAEILTLDACVRTALADHPLLTASDQAEKAAHAGVGLARAAYYPTLGVRGTASRWQDRAFLPNGLELPNISATVGPTDDYRAGGFARWMIYDGGVRGAENDSARAQESVTTEEAASIRLEVVHDAHQAFYRLAIALDMKTVSDEGKANADAHLALAKTRQAAGAVTETDVLRAQVAADNAGAERIRIQSLIRSAEGDLNTAMGLPAEQPVTIDPASAPRLFPDEPDPAVMLEQALRTRPEIKAAREAVSLAQSKVRSAESAFGPKVYADGAYGWRDDTFVPRDEAWSAGVSVEWTAFEGGARKSALERARAEAARAQALMDQAVLGVRREVWSACARVRESHELTLATVTQVRNAEESVRLTTTRYQVGAVPLTDLLDTQLDLTAARARNVQARWSCQQSGASLLRAVGSLAEAGGAVK